MAGSTLNNLTASIINSTLQPDAREEQQLSTRKRRVAALRTARAQHPSITNAVEFVLGAPPPRRYGVAAPEDGDLKVAQAQPNPRPKAEPSSPSRVRLIAAPLSLRRRCRRPRQFCRIGRVPTGRICPLKRAGDGFLVQNPVFSHVVLRSRACAIHLYSAHRRNS